MYANLRRHEEKETVRVRVEIWIGTRRIRERERLIHLRSASFLRKIMQCQGLWCFASCFIIHSLVSIRNRPLYQKMERAICLSVIAQGKSTLQQRLMQNRATHSGKRLSIVSAVGGAFAVVPKFKTFSSVRARPAAGIIIMQLQRSTVITRASEKKTPRSTQA